MKYFYIKARYLDFDRKVLKETLSQYTIEKFQGAKQITTLKVFPLKYHLSKSHIRAYLTKYGQKFLSIIDVHLCEYKGKAFYIEKERVVEILIKSQVMVNAPYFQEENPNYSRLSIKDKGPQGPPILVDNKEEGPAKDNRIDLLEVKGDDLLIYSLIVPRFSLGNNRWGKHLILFY